VSANNIPSSVPAPPASTVALQPKYTRQIPISRAKKKDLIDLCRTKVIDDDYYSSYEALPADTGVEDKLPSPEVEEESCNED
jgi:hypothetical protein